MVDDCPQCGNRAETSARKYEKERDHNLALMMEGFAAEADNPENCANALHTLMIYDMEPWFHDVRKSYGLRFETNMQIQYLIAQGLLRFGHYHEAGIYCRKAIVLGAGKQAEELLAYCETLIQASEGSGDMETLKVQAESVLRAYVPMITFAVSTAIILVMMCVSSLRTHKAWIVNGSLQTYTFTLDNKPYELAPGTTRQITLRLGAHEIATDGLPLCRFDYSVPFIKQWLEKHLLVINPDGMALLALAEDSDNARNSPTIYSSSGQIRIFPGLASPQHGLRRISGHIPRTASISLYRPESHLAMVQLLSQLDLPEAATGYARQALLMSPDSMEAGDLLKTALKGAEDADVLSFLRNGLASSPVLLPWHLYYQNYMRIHHPEHDLAREYTLRCKDHSDDPACYYLLGLVVQNREAAYSLLEHADKMNGMGGLGFQAIAQDLYVRGRFKQALPYSLRAIEQAPGDAGYRELNDNILLALRDYDTLLANTIASGSDTASIDQAEKTVRYLTCAGFHREAAAKIVELGGIWPRDLPRLNAARYYAVGNINDYLDCMADAKNPHSRMETLLQYNRIEEADELISQKEDHPYWEHLVLYCAAVNQNQPEIAQRNLEKGIAEADTSIYCYYVLTRMIRGEVAVSEAAITDLDIPAPEKAILCVVLNYRFQNLQPLIQLAASYNFTPSYPQLLIKRWINRSSTNTAYAVR